MSTSILNQNTGNSENKIMSEQSENTVHLIIGGARSGKSRLAEQLAKDSNKNVVYIATATAYDDEMKQRIKRHIEDRPSHWLTVEEPINLAKVIALHANDSTCIVVDCLTLWLSNLLMNENAKDKDKLLAEHKEELLSVLANSTSQIILVTNEVGQGIVPMGELSRRFVDESGWLHQDIARIVGQVTLVVAGLPMPLKSR